MGAKRADQTGVIVFPQENGVPLQIVKWTERRAFINFTDPTARVILPAGAEILEITATENVYINFGDVTVDASAVIATDDSRLFLAGVQTVVVPLDGAGVPFTYIAAFTAGVDGIIQVEEAS